MPSWSATRRASSTSDTEQQPVSDSPPHSFMVTPTTSWPCSCSSAAATEESTPPDMATSTLMPDGPSRRPKRRAAARPRRARRRGRRRRRRRWSTSRATGGGSRRRRRAGTPMAASTWVGSCAPARTTTPPTRRRRGPRAGRAAPRSRRRRCTRGSCRRPCRGGRGSDRVDRGLDQAGDGGEQAVGQAVAQGAEAARPSRARVSAVSPSGRGGADDAGHVLRAAAPLPLLAAAEQAGRERRARAGRRARRRPWGRRTCGPTATAGRRGDRRRLVGAEVEPRERLHRVGVHHAPAARARRPGRARRARSAIDADLVVGHHHRHQRRRSSSSTRGQVVEVDPPVGVAPGRRGRPRCSTGSSTAWCSVAGHTAVAGRRGRRRRGRRTRPGCRPRCRRR